MSLIRDIQEFCLMKHVALGFHNVCIVVTVT